VLGVGGSETGITLGEPDPDLPAFDARDVRSPQSNGVVQNYASQRAVIPAAAFHLIW
jgi:hypothetical protein